MNSWKFNYFAKSPLFALLLAWAQLAPANPIPDLPEAVSNNAVASVRTGNTEYVMSFAGISAGLTHADIHARTLVYDGSTKHWRRAPDVPGGVGRLAAVAATAADQVYVFGGYTVAKDGSEVSTPWAHIFDPITSRFSQLESMPVPVDDAVAVTYADRYIYLISGWHDLGNINLVQVLDTESGSWSQATPLPGNALFGHAGGIVGNQMLYCDGVTVVAKPIGAREFVASAECFLGSIDADNFRRINWHPVAAHPGPPRYRMAASGIADDNSIVFVGGSTNPYNYNGIGYNGNPSEPSGGGFKFDLEHMRWEIILNNNAASMDHRGLVRFENTWLTIGGMLDDQRVSANATTQISASDK